MDGAKGLVVSRRRWGKIESPGAHWYTAPGGTQCSCAPECCEGELAANSVKLLDTKSGSAKAAVPPVARRPEDLLSFQPSTVVIRPAVGGTAHCRRAEGSVLARPGCFCCWRSCVSRTPTFRDSPLLSRSWHPEQQPAGQSGHSTRVC
ncbi:hypothetical protein mRhiFer1_008530 [Rhinolophus ferrumequinum]|uniref:Uncharacterized protein n=1 Tax=Rhinolophus ferrumequinum TaxID=59479 RepID=A0A7J7UX30_RHIFE|nr:hypothetical protein mRhiFer1_008530 [Rhinolophus ferrumequinum]